MWLAIACEHYKPEADAGADGRIAVSDSAGRESGFPGNPVSSGFLDVFSADDAAAGATGPRRATAISVQGFADIVVPRRERGQVVIRIGVRLGHS